MANTLVKAAAVILFGGLVRGNDFTPRDLTLGDLTLRDLSPLDVSPRDLSPRALTVAGPGTLPAGWSYLGCYLDTGNPRTLGSAAYTSNTAMTEESCATYCQGLKYIYAGVEYSQECYCGNYFTGNVSEPATDCSMACTGNANEPCGGPNRLNIFWSGGTPPPPPATDPGPPGWKFLNCYAEGTNGRALTTGMAVTGGSSKMTVALCTAACGAAGFSLAGLEYAQECYCGNAIANGGALAPGGISDCNMLCTGNSSEFCGAGNRLDVYQSIGTGGGSGTTSTAAATTTTPALPSNTGGPQHVATVGAYTWAGCYTEATNGRALTGATDVNYNTMTIEICAAFCHAYTTFGVEYSGECYCGNALQPGSVLANTGDCSMLCDGNQLEYCGGPNRLDLYKGTPSTATTTPGGAASTTASTTSSAATVTGNGGATALPAGWKYGGCWVDNLDGRVMGNQQPDNQALTIEKCINTCIGLGFPVAGIEYGLQCFCDNELFNGAALAQNQGDCSTPCPGAASENCGNGNRLSVFNTGTLTALGIPVEQTGNISSWTYRGCRTDNIGNPMVRTLPWQLILPLNNSATTCLLQCSKFGYNAAGMEYGEECYCGDIAAVAAGASTLAPETDCATVCTGNASEICGGGNRLSYYEWTGPALYNWHTPTGAGAGAYQFLIGGLVVALISTPGVNGKVTFLEKYGTSVNASSTGAYELDLFYLNDFSKAWRTMHLKTDVFCSASLTLPDKVGRQINIGGWAEESVFGIRLYWPDGSPGVPGVNDWQENYSELHLQTARWYPSAMIMTNGSILVVGGEVGSNSAPSPTLELLPPTGGGLVFADWLNRTDPNNLYPFLAVVPSGGIFVAYYNEARILDPVTFNTIKVLPNMPGNVNNFLAGRTYPLEGTMVLLPQHAPYTDALSVLICGGSTIGGGQASDNCVSTQPDNTNPVWAIERMPSQRVMTCMCALPDGTYLIVNGAHQGVAGFGLATSPNLVAVLYDPSQVIGSRMSILSSTIVARLYHSEASLLQDGRVIISGSDPQDGVHPEEYRVEVFVPPYLLNGATAPSITIANKDWTYGQPYAVTVNIPSGNTANVKFSLMGAASSTHGNSMGQRTIFPAFTCTSTTSCSITAPPGVNVSPPGWFQVFVLDNGTPGTSVWVRIGGDPGKLGNWPSGLPDFTVPGV